MIVPDGGIDKIAAAFGEEASYGKLPYQNSFDVETSAEKQIALAGTIRENLNREGFDLYIESAEAARADFLATYGGLLFLGIFLGGLFVAATILIMYYKQISEGYNDRARFAIMQKVGLTKDEVRGAIHCHIRVYGKSLL